jgi:eukaryotic-like serine/threonine-protein kinase
MTIPRGCHAPTEAIGSERILFPERTPMPGKVTLSVTQGPFKDRVFTFEQHDTFVLGRSPDCHASLPDDDPTVSRHHFVLEVNPPHLRLRDLGSLNGTYVNDVQYGGRDPEETPEAVAHRRCPEVDIGDGDCIQAGDTILKVKVELPKVCTECGAELDPPEVTGDGRDLCGACLERMEAGNDGAEASRLMLCKQCGKEFSPEVMGEVGADYLCESCRKSLESNPILGLVRGLVAKFKRDARIGKAEIPGYRVGEMLGPGGMGAVYRAWRENDGTEVALKIMLSKVPVYEDARGVFLREIEVTRSLRHPNIVALYEYGSVGGGFYFVMEYCPGGNVETLMKERGGVLTVDQAMPIMLQVLEGLAFAHERGFVHRDLNPKNVLLTAQVGGVAKISDMGLAKNFQKAGFSGLTVTGITVGSPPLIPREQLLNFKYVRPVSDIWSIGAVLYHMLTGKIPYEAKEGQSPIDVVFEGRIIPIRNRYVKLPRKLCRVVDKALAVKPEERFETAREFRDALLECE